MASVHGVVTVHAVDPVLWIGGLLGAVLAVHLIRALAVSPATAQRWAVTRSLPPEPRTIGEVERHVRRLHWGRFLATALLGAVSLTLALLSRPTVSFASLPLFAGVLLAELLVPEPPRGRVRSAVLARRSTSYFAPGGALRVTRFFLLSGVLLGGWGVLAGLDTRSSLLTHVVALILGSAVLELALRRLTMRGLPDWPDDLALDCAIRVADARSLTAAGLVFATIGCVLSAVPVLQVLGQPGAAMFSALVPIAVSAVGVWALTLTQPLPSWQPA